MMRMLALLAVTLALGGYPEEVALAKADWATRTAAGENPRYLSLGQLPGHIREQAMVADNFWMPHLSRSLVLERQLPQQLGDTSLWRIDLDQLGWGTTGWIELNKENPYLPEHWHDPLIVRADWLLAITSDADVSKSYYTLLFGTTPKDRDEYLRLVNVNAGDIKRFRVGVVIDHGHSGVADDTRLWTWTTTAGGSFSETFDSKEAFGKNDPLEQLGGGLKFDAGELITTLPKTAIRTGKRSFVMSYILVNGQGKRIDKADTNIVIDHTKFRNDPTIRTPGSCVGCHLSHNGPSQNLLREFIAEGVQVATKDKKTQDFLELFYLADNTTIISRANEDFTQFCKSACGTTPANAVSSYRAVIHFYDQPLSLEQAAREVYAKDAAELRNALGYYSHVLGPLKAARFAGLASDRPVPRRSWEGDRKTHQVGVYSYAVEALRSWRAK